MLTEVNSAPASKTIARPDDFIERTPRPNDKDQGSATLTYRLSGNWLASWQRYMERSGATKNSDVIREALSLLFACASTDASGEPVKIILRHKAADGQDLPDEDLVEFLRLRTLKVYRASPAD